VLDDFEDGAMLWQVEAADPAAQCILGVMPRGGSRQMRLYVRSAGKGPVRIVRDVEFGKANCEALTLDVMCYCAQPVTLALGMLTVAEDGKTAFYETRSVTLNKGANPGVRFDLRGRDLRCEASGWRYEAGLDDLGAVKRITLLFYMEGRGFMYVDNVALAGKP